MAKTILLADDSVTIQKVVELTFMEQDYEVVAVSDGNAALEKLPQLRPDLVIADVHMPGADGYEVCSKCRASFPEIPVLLLVGTFEQFDEDQAEQAGAHGHLKKPFDSQDLLSKVESLTNQSPSAAAPAVVSTPSRLCLVAAAKSQNGTAPHGPVRRMIAPAEAVAPAEAQWLMVFLTLFSVI